MNSKVFAVLVILLIACFVFAATHESNQRAPKAVDNVMSGEDPFNPEYAELLEKEG